eukprot:m.194907 g.194907  ORF g.194907 m.194907 type:complete len:246 (-) comp53713_c0_seq30:135-872(-)
MSQPKQKRRTEDQAQQQQTAAEPQQQAATTEAGRTAEIARALATGVDVFDDPSEELRALFPRDAPLFQFRGRKVQVPSAPFDAISTALERGAHNPLLRAWQKEWAYLQPSVTTLIVAAEAAGQFADFFAQCDDTTNVKERSAQLADLLFDLLNRQLQRATIIVAGSSDPSKASRLDHHFEVETLGIHPDAIAVLRERKSEPVQRAKFSRRGAEPEQPQPKGRGRGRGKPRGGQAGASSSAGPARD